VQPNRSREHTVSRFDIQGRRIAKLLENVVETAGAHDVMLVTDGWPAGCYLYRLRALGESLTHKVVVVE
jgi:hypothetical protein